MQLVRQSSLPEYKNLVPVLSNEQAPVKISQSCFRCATEVGLADSDITSNMYTHVFLWSCPVCGQRNADVVFTPDPNGQFRSMQRDVTPFHETNQATAAGEDSDEVQQFLDKRAKELDRLPTTIKEHERQERAEEQQNQDKAESKSWKFNWLIFVILLVLLAIGGVVAYNIFL